VEKPRPRHRSRLSRSRYDKANRRTRRQTVLDRLRGETENRIDQPGFARATRAIPPPPRSREGTSTYLRLSRLFQLATREVILAERYERSFAGVENDKQTGNAGESRRATRDEATRD